MTNSSGARGPRFASALHLRQRTRADKFHHLRIVTVSPQKAYGSHTSNFLSGLLPDLHRHPASSQEEGGATIQEKAWSFWESNVKLWDCSGPMPVLQLTQAARLIVFNFISNDL